MHMHAVQLIKKASDGFRHRLRIYNRFSARTIGRVEMVEHSQDPLGSLGILLRNDDTEKELGFIEKLHGIESPSMLVCSK